MVKTKRKESPDCAKIWEFIYKLGGDYEQYATNIVDICARDMLSHHRGLTVIIPNPSFRDRFHDNIHEKGGSVATAKKMLKNTILRKYFDATADFNRSEYKEAIPTSSGLPIAVENVTGDLVTLTGGVKIRKRDDFSTPSAFNYAVWEVISGEYPITTDFEVKKSPKHKTKKNITGGSKNTFIVNIGRKLRSSSDARRVGMIANILSQYRAMYLSSNACQVNPLLDKGVSLYNWLEMYAPAVYQHCLVVTDIHPGINLLLLILDPNSPITDDLLFGDCESNAVATRNGWNGSSVTSNSHKEWSDHLERASKWCSGNDDKGYLRSLNEIRNKLRKYQPRDLVMKYYKDPLKYIKSTPEFEASLQHWYKNYPWRKLWQDEFRMVCTFGFSTLATVRITSLDDSDDIFRNMVTFRPSDTTKYDEAASFSFEGGNYQSKENDYLLSKFFMSTNFGYMPSSCTNEDSLCRYSLEKKGLSAKLDGPVSMSDVCNCHKIKCDMFESMRGISNVNPELYYGLEFKLRKQKNGQDNNQSIDELFNKMSLNDQGSSNIRRNDDYDVRGGGSGLRRSLSKREKIIQQGASDSEDQSDVDQLSAMQLFMVPDNIKSELISSENESPGSIRSSGSAKIRKKRHHRKRRHSRKSR